VTRLVIQKIEMHSSTFMIFACKVMLHATAENTLVTSGFDQCKKKQSA